jgi:hypothetical protein
MYVNYSLTNWYEAFKHDSSMEAELYSDLVKWYLIEISQAKYQWINRFIQAR